MTTTPTTWLDSTQINTSSTGFQGHQDIVGLSNGNVLVTFTDESGTVGAGADRDIVGVIYDANGGIVRDLFQVNVARNAHDEETASIAATNDGGFVMAYVDRDSDGRSIILERFDANGNSIDSVVAQQDPGSPVVINPKVTVDPSDNSVFVTYQYWNSNDDSLRGKAFDANLNLAPGTPPNGYEVRSDDITTSARGVYDNETTVLSNGNYVTVFREPDSDDFFSYNIEFRISSGSTGANLSNVNVTAGAAPAEFAPDVAALAGGRFVVVWVEDEGTNDNIRFQIFNNNGINFTLATTVIDTPNDYGQPRVIGLEDGGFYVVAVDKTENTLEGTRFDASGTRVGSNMAAIQSGITNDSPDPQVSLTTDGRILVTYDQDGDVFSEILDPRDPGAITADPGDGQITAGRTASTITGSSAGEKIYSGPQDDTVFAGLGADTFDFAISRDGVSIRETPGGWQATSSLGTDTLSGIEFFEFAEGTVDAAEPVLSGLVFVTEDTTSGARFIEGGTTYSGPVATLQRQLLMSSANEAVQGTASNDFVNTFGGFDAINARGGNDVLDGGTGSNFLTGGLGDDIFFTDARIPGLTTWSTITDFNPAVEEATIWGWTPGISSGQWVPSDGAAGFQGATFHADVDGNGLIDTSITFTGLSQAQIMTPLELDGLLWFA